MLYVLSNSNLISDGTVVDLMNQHLSAGFSETLVRQIFTGIVDAVALMHDNGYSHRDLKVP